MEFDEFLLETWQAMNKARTGYGVADTEEVMRQARNQLERFGHGDHIGLDYYHFSEHVSEAARIYFGEGSEQAAAWRKRMLGLALTTGVDEVLDGIMQTCRQTRAPSKRDALRPPLSAQLHRRADGHDPLSAKRTQGWAIGSGPTARLGHALGPGRRPSHAAPHHPRRFQRMGGLLAVDQRPRESVTPLASYRRVRTIASSREARS